MRLICPNCDAEYEVDGTLFPAEGREVQCSNCSNTWFVKPGGDTADEAGPAQTPPELTTEPSDAPAEDSAPSDPPRQEADPRALDILHAEVEREKLARAEDANGLETQADLGLGDVGADSAQSPSERSLVTDDGADASLPSSHIDPDEAALAPAPRRPDGAKRELLPDIEEINSTLADAPDPEFEDGETGEKKQSDGRQSFRLGFGLALLVAAGLIMAYAYAPEIAVRFPEVAEALQSYVEFVDKARVTLAMATDALAEKINDLTEQVGSAS
ncbi:MAG: zinc-ribbon domain-containing protein [Pseudomonadota bacterium]